MKLSGKLYVCKVCNKSKQLNQFYIHQSGKQKGCRTTATCIDCTKDIKQVYRDTNKELIAKYRESFYTKQDKEYFDKLKAYKSEYDKANPLKRLERNRKYRLKNPSKYAAYTAAYKLRYPEVVTNDAAKRRAAKIDRVPSWSTPQDLADIRSIYKACKKISDKTGVKHHVDHIIPLRGKLVSGLHTPTNLQIIPDYLNLQKNNTYEIL